MPKREMQDAISNTGVVKEFARMWPREVFDYPGAEKKFLANELLIPKQPGVYILYRDDLPYYIGKSDRTLFGRLFEHARRPGGRYDYFWNYFSVFVIPEARNRTMVESMLIAAMPTANSAKPKAFDRHPIPPEVIKMMKHQREHRAKLGREHTEVK
jgi:hypothetical protein